VLNLETGCSFSRSQLEKVFSRPAVLTWFHLHDRNKLSELEAGILIKQKKLEAMADVSPVFKNALARYIYLDGTTDAYDRQLEAIVSLAAGKAAIESAYVWFRPDADLLARRGHEAMTRLAQETLARQAAGDNRGLIILTPHIGCFEMGARAYGLTAPITVLYKAPRHPAIPSGRHRHAVTDRSAPPAPNPRKTTKASPRLPMLSA